VNSSPQRWAVLLRSVNVGGHNTVKMAQLRDALQTAGFDDVQTYIQSGNITLTSQDGSGRWLCSRCADYRSVTSANRGDARRVSV
jgi:uncharacterized protein (DUF1697 family)